MKNSLPAAITLIVASASTAFASSGSGESGIGIMTILFFGFFGLILANQLLPGLALFIAGTKSLFGKRNKQAGAGN